MYGTVSNKDVDMVELPKIYTHDLNFENIRACILIFSTLTSIPLFLKSKVPYSIRLEEAHVSP